LPRVAISIPHSAFEDLIEGEGDSLHIDFPFTDESVQMQSYLKPPAFG
jgi:hypothetical protein